jgi:subtilisin-like proprotein convertase family protein
MKSTLIAVALALTVCLPAPAALYTYDFNGINAVIPDGDINGLADTRTLSGMTGSQITDVNVTLNISGGYNGDLYGYLVHSSGFAILLNRVGRTAGDGFGYAGTGLAITLDDAAGTDVHLYETVSHPLNGGGQLTGTWNPDGRNVDPDAVVDTDSRTALLSSFNGGDPNGSWTLFMADMAGGEQSTLVGWQLEISTVPEPIEWALGIFAAVAGATQLVRWLVRRYHNRRPWRRLWQGC